MQAQLPATQAKFHEFRHRLIADTEYLRGTAKTDECEGLFKDYKMCLSVRTNLPSHFSSRPNISPTIFLLSFPIRLSLETPLHVTAHTRDSNKRRKKRSKKAETSYQKALKERGLDKMLDEARADNAENDIEYMKPSNSRS